jgi:MerR family transcriptional regulator/heat shock protein HspR
VSPEKKFPPPESDPAQGVYAISVAADLVGSAPQNLRLYEARGLVTPARSDGGTRRYSPDDLDRLRHIGRLLDAGLNLAGVDMVLKLQAVIARLTHQLDEAAARRPVRPTGPTNPVRRQL